ncbi:DUF481 domain-containing protein [Thalassotalea sp. LPB0316]|uniref:DUF481 domain-containing protein n=1 Tax=Thalassotalea sp. LPB0316 TaxID=2769490 RepID=UPI0018671ADB|nr:DUF481 domain-containing protein [Thalassotalea sp. LPB0316]QOL25360.1 DUF481 domain-containing protein [Thalassotalea sp. LPB0316]
MKTKMNVLALALVPFISLAQDDTTSKEPELTTAIELGFLLKTGNTNSADIRAGAELRYDLEHWRNSLNFNILGKKGEVTDEEGNDKWVTSDQTWNIAGKTNYILNERGTNYIYGSGDYKQDRFSGFESQSSMSTGWGRRWYKTEVASFDADIGPGFKRDVVSATETTAEETRDAFIIQASGLYLHKINSHVQFRQFVSAKYAPKNGENNVYRSETSVITKLIETLQLKFSLNIDHNSVVEPGTKKTDTETAVTLVYSF